MLSQNKKKTQKGKPGLHIVLRLGKLMTTNAINMYHSFFFVESIFKKKHLIRWYCKKKKKKKEVVRLSFYCKAISQKTFAIFSFH